MAPLPTLLMREDQVALATDLYELTMAAGYFETGLMPQAEFELFIRDLPPKRGYLIAAGLEQALAYLQALRFTDDDIAFLQHHPTFRHVSPQFFEYLRDLRFTGDVFAMPEGTAVFAEEPLVRVRAPIIEAQLIETYLLTTITYQTLVASKAARVVQAAGGRGVADFGSRRAHGPQAGLLAARASYIGGCDGTSNVLAAQLLGIPAVGTAAHSWTMAFREEVDAFHAYTKVFPESVILLIDTYDTIEGARRAIAAAGPALRGVRLDSGDIGALAKEVRQILDHAGCTKTKIVASGDLDEYRIADLLAGGAPIDLFGVGTHLVTGHDAPSLGGVYKLVAVEEDGGWRPVVKTSAAKATFGWPKQVFRRAGSGGRFSEDTIVRIDETAPGEPLLTQVMAHGRLTGPGPTLAAGRDRARAQLAHLDEAIRRLDAPEHYPVRRSDTLRRTATENLKA